jgi:hypothetical protein
MYLPNDGQPGFLENIFGYLGIVQQTAYKVAQWLLVSLDELGKGVPVANLAAKQQHLVY